MAAQSDRSYCDGRMYRDTDAVAGVRRNGQYIGSAADLHDDADRIFMQYVSGMCHILELRFVQTLILNMCGFACHMPIDREDTHKSWYSIKS